MQPVATVEQGGSALFRRWPPTMFCDDKRSVPIRSRVKPQIMAVGEAGQDGMRALIGLAAMMGAALMPSSAFAWGDIGHRVICQIAYAELKPEIKARVDALVAIDPKFRTFADACTAPDHPHIRSPEHYVDLPRSAKGIEVAHPCPVADRCVISAILNDTRDLALSLDVSDQGLKAWALGWRRPSALARVL